MPQQPRFLWRGLLIVLPALVMAVFGLVSLRQDRLLVRHQATEEAERLVDALVHNALPIALRFDPHAPSVGTMGLTSAPGEDPVVRAARVGMIACLMDENGALAFPPEPRWPPPAPLDLSALTPSQKTAWTNACSALSRVDEVTAPAELWEQLLALELPGQFEVQARLYLLDLKLRARQFDRAWSQLIQIRTRHSEEVTEAGFPARIMAEWRWLKASSLPAELDFPPDVEALYAYAIEQPGPLSEAIAADLSQGRMNLLTTPGVNLLRYVWMVHGRARKLADLVLHAQATGLPIATNGSRGWARVGGEDLLLLTHNIEASTWWMGWPRDMVAHYVRKAVESVSIPSYLGCSITSAGRSLTPPTVQGTVLATASAILDPATGAEVTTSILLVDPDLLYARQRKRTLWFGLLIGVSAAAVCCGVWAAWRGFREQQHLAEMKSNFVSSVSHEMRAPIASVRLMAEELVDRGGSDPAKSGEYHGYILQECRRLSALIENVLDFSRHEQGRRQYCFEEVDLVLLVEETLHIMRSYAASRTVELRLETQGVPIEAEVDGSAIRQVIVNLLDNAIKHSPTGSTVVIGLEFPENRSESPFPEPGWQREDRPFWLRPYYARQLRRRSRSHARPGEAVRSRIMRPSLWTRLTAPKQTHSEQVARQSKNRVARGSSIRIWVRDKGPGIPEKEHQLIFQRFYRCGSELRRETPGIGLGLAIVHYLVEAHRGEVIVESQVGKGSRFTVELPITQGNRS